MIYSLSIPFDVSENNSTIFWPAWQECRPEMETNGDVVSYMKNAFGNKFRSDNDDGWILSLAVDKIVRILNGKF